MDCASPKVNPREVDGVRQIVQVAEVVAIGGNAEEDCYREQESGRGKQQGHPASYAYRSGHHYQRTDHRQEENPGEITCKYHNILAGGRRVETRSAEAMSTKD